MELDESNLKIPQMLDCLRDNFKKLQMRVQTLETDNAKLQGNRLSLACDMSSRRSKPVGDHVKFATENGMKVVRPLVPPLKLPQPSPCDDTGDNDDECDLKESISDYPFDGRGSTLNSRFSNDRPSVNPSNRFSNGQSGTGQQGNEAQKLYWIRPEWEVDEFQVRRCARMSTCRIVIEKKKKVGLNRLGMSRSILNTSLNSSEGFVAIHPQGRFRLVWDLCGAIFVMFDVIVVPLEFFNMPETGFSVLCAWVIAIYWTLDVGISMITAQFIHGQLETRFPRIVKRYIRTWMAFDMVIVVPEWILLLQSNITDVLQVFSILRVLRMLRFVRLLRLVKLDRAISVFQDRINSNYILLCAGIMKLVTCLLFVNHFLGCMWYGIGVSTSEGWANDLSSDTIAMKYLVSVNWALGQFHGEQTILPRNFRERFVNVMVLFLALTMFSSFLSSVTSLTVQLQSLTRDQTRKKHALHSYLHDHNISIALSARVKRYVVEQLMRRRPQENEVELLALLTPGLLAELHDEARAPVLSLHQFFCDLRAENLRVVTRLCHEAIRHTTTQASETLFHTGDASMHMLFIESGRMLYSFQMHKMARQDLQELSTFLAEAGVDKDGFNVDGKDELPNDDDTPLYIDNPADIVCTHGMWLSEATLWMIWEHCGELLAGSDSSFLALDAGEFARILKAYEIAHVHSCLYARSFVEHLCENPKARTDVIGATDSPPSLDDIVRKYFRASK